MFYNVAPEDIKIKDGEIIKQAILEATGNQDFNYLGSWVYSEERGKNVRKAIAMAVP